LELPRRYARRFGPADQARKQRVSRVLGRSFFPRYMEAGATVLDLGAGQCEPMDTERAADVQGPIPKGNPLVPGDLVMRTLGRSVGVVCYPEFWRGPCAALRGLPWTRFKRLKA
jgi:hypothetical protein